MHTSTRTRAATHSSQRPALSSAPWGPANTDEKKSVAADRTCPAYCHNAQGCQPVHPSTPRVASAHEHRSCSRSPQAATGRRAVDQAQHAPPHTRDNPSHQGSSRKTAESNDEENPALSGRTDKRRQLHQTALLQCDGNLSEPSLHISRCTVPPPRDSSKVASRCFQDSLTTHGPHKSNTIRHCGACEDATVLHDLPSPACSRIHPIEVVTP